MSDGFLFTSESVTEGHPDKVADQISDAIVDAALASDPASRVAVETLLTTGLVVLAGEITTTSVIDFPALARQVICEIGYDTGEFGFDGNAVGVIDVKTPQVEPAELVASRIRRALDYVPADRLMINPDCGLRHLAPEVARQKLRAMVAGVAAVRAELESAEPGAAAARAEPGPAEPGSEPSPAEPREGGTT